MNPVTPAKAANASPAIQRVPCGSPCSAAELRWIQITATLASLIGVMGLLALLSQGAWAADERGGFKPGPRTFTNPFANTPTSPPPSRPAFFDEEDEEDGPDFGAPPAGAPSFTPPSSPGASAPAPSRPAPGGAPFSSASSGISGGGTANPGGVIAGRQAPASIEVNSETGEGSKEVVTDFNFPDADILDIAKTLGKLTGKNFILDKDVKGRITIISNSAITVGDAWKAFLTALDINGFALIPSGKYIRIARQRDARDKQLKTYTGDFSPDTDALITRVIPLKYIDAEEVARTFRSFMPANSRIIPYEQTNTVIVTDTGSNIAKMVKMLDILDVEGYDLGIEVISVKFASASELSKLIDTLLPGTGAAPGAPPGAPRFGGGPGGRFNARRTKEGGVINTIIADERTNTLIINANSKGADQVRELVAKLDQKLPAQTGGGKVHVVYLQFADAEQIANTLNNLATQATSSLRPPTPAGGGGVGVNPMAASLFEGAIKVAADKATNSLVITASPSDFVTVQRVINRLDIPRDEVFVEVVIMEVALNRAFDFSANVASPASAILSTPNTDLFDFIANPISKAGLVLGFKAGKETPITIGNTTVNVSSVQGLIKAIQTHSKSNVLATPQIIALDNSEANFESTEKIPVLVSTAVQGAGVSTSTSKENVSLSIKIKPQINKMSNFVKLDITTKLGDVSNRVLPSQVANLAFATLERSAQTTVVVGDSDTVVIGGLMRDKVSETVSKIPLLGDIPLLGWLFRSKSSQTEKTNLLIFMTPHIVRQYEKVRAILDKKLKERDDFLEANTGGDDPLRHKRDDMIRNLPDLKEITAKRQTAVTIGNEDPAAVPVQPTSPFTGGNPPGKAPPLESKPATGGVTPPAAPPAAPPATPSSDALAPVAPPPAPELPPDGSIADVPPPPTAPEGGTP